jgi:glutathione S-transferase
MSDLILHAYDASPFTQKALRMLGLKRLAWRWVETPMLPPKDDLVALTGGYRGTPVLQIGADVFVDSQRIAAELERLHPAPTLFPGGDHGSAWMLVKWSEAFFRTGLAISVNLLGGQWPAEFAADRRQLFPDFDFDAALADARHAQTQFRVHAGWLDRQLASRGPFLTGAAPGLADIQAHVFVWMARAYFPDLAARLLAEFQALPAWESGMAALGEGQRTRIEAAEAIAIAREGKPQAVSAGAVAAQDPLGLRAGEQVEVMPDDTRRGAVRGELVALSWDGVSVRRHDPRCGEVCVHFPRIGYRVERARA